MSARRAQKPKPTLEEEDPLTTSYDIDQLPNTDIFDPATGWEQTSDDLGLPEGIVGSSPGVEAAIEERLRQNAEDAEGEGADEG